MWRPIAKAIPQNECGTTLTGLTKFHLNVFPPMHVFKNATWGLQMHRYNPTNYMKVINHSKLFILLYNVTNKTFNLKYYAIFFFE